VQLPVENGEDLQILRYEHGQKYDEHWDWFDAEELEKMNMTDGNRIATVLMYLSGTDRTLLSSAWLSACAKIVNIACAFSDASTCGSTESSI